MVERWGFEDPACGGEEVSATVRKEMKKRKKKNNFTYVPANEEMVAAGLARLEGGGTVERWGFEDPACEGKEVSATVRKETKKRKKKKNHIFTYVPRNEEKAGAGLARLEGRGTGERWGFEDPA